MTAPRDPATIPVALPAPAEPAKPEEPKPQFASISAMKPPPPDAYLIDRVLKPNTLALVAAADGVGKSHLRRQLGISLALGGDVPPLFGYYTVREAATVLVVDEENGESEEWTAEERILEGLHAERAACYYYKRMSYAAVNLEDEKWQAWLAGLCEINHDEAPERPVVLILDHISLMVTKEWGEEFKPVARWMLQLLAKWPWLTIVLIAHMVKPDRQNKAKTSVLRELQDVLGNLPRSMGSVAIVSDLGDDRIIWTMHKRVPKTSIVLQKGNGLWNYSHEAAGGRISHGIDNAVVIDVIASNNGQITANELAKTLKEILGRPVSKDTASRVLEEMVQANEIDRYELGQSYNYILKGHQP